MQSACDEEGARARIVPQSGIDHPKWSHAVEVNDENVAILEEDNSNDKK